MNAIIAAVAITLNIGLAFGLTLLAVPQGFRRRWAMLALGFATAVTCAYARLGQHQPFGYFVGALVGPWLVWLPTAIVFSATIRSRCGLPTLNKWIYIGTVIVTCGMYGLAIMASHDLLVRAAISLPIVMLTYPAGLLAEPLAIAPIQMGIATAAEGYVLISPVFAALGYLQWYILAPWILRKRNHQPLDRPDKGG